MKDNIILEIVLKYLIVSITITVAVYFILIK